MAAALFTMETVDLQARHRDERQEQGAMTPMRLRWTYYE